MVFKGFRPPVNDQGQQEPENNHKEQPQKRAHQKGHGVYLFQVKQNEGGQGEYINQDDHDPQFRPADKMIPERLDHFPLFVIELYGHVER